MNHRQRLVLLQPNPRATGTDGAWRDRRLRRRCGLRVSPVDCSYYTEKKKNSSNESSFEGTHGYIFLCQWAGICLNIANLQKSNLAGSSQTGQSNLRK